MKITLKTNVGELIENYPESAEILRDYGIPCASCHFSSYDSIGESVAEFGIDGEDLEDLIRELNELTKDGEI